MKNLTNLGKTLSKKEQKAIHGGAGGECDHERRICTNGCYQGLYASWGSLVSAAGCFMTCEAISKVCEASEAVQGAR